MYGSTMGNDVTTTVEQAKARLRANGITIKAWADEHDFSLTSVRAVISGHNKGHYGKAHEIAVALGIKEQAE